MKITTALANALLTTYATQASSGRVRIYSGSAPTTAAEAATGTLLWEDSLASTIYSSITGAVMIIDHSVLSANGLAGAGAGTVAGYFRVYASDATTPLWQGTVTASGAGGEMQLGSTTIASGALVAVSLFTITHSLGA